jgi:RecA-family ATPase
LLQARDRCPRHVVAADRERESEGGMSDALTTRAAQEWRAERDNAERAYVSRLAVLQSPPPADPDDYGAQAPAPIGVAEGKTTDGRDLPVISAACFDGVAPPERRWIVMDTIPDRTVTIVAGDGGGGKTTLMLQLAAALAAGCPWLGYDPDPGRVLFVTAEDDEDEIHRRLAAIAKGFGIGLSDLADLHIVPLAGRDAVMAAPQGKAALIAPTAVFHGLLALVERIRPRLVVLDALADVFGGEENARAQARQFIGLLRGLAIDHILAVVLIAHPSLSGMASGSGTSGSTAWSNSVRARLYLERIVDDGNREIDPDLRVLRVKKSNYGPVGLELRLRWQNGAFVLDGNAGTFDKLAADAKAERVFLDLLAAYTAQGRDVCDVPGHSYAPNEFAEQGDEPMSKPALKGAMKRLLFAGRIRVEKFGPPSKQRKRLVIENEDSK